MGLSPGGRQAHVFEVISPHTEQSIAEVAAAGPADVDAAVNAARAAFDSGPWGRGEPAERIAAIRRLADVYDQRSIEMARTITAEIGAPITFAQRAQVGLPAMMMRAFCDLAERHQWQETRTGFFGADVHVRKEPVGVVAAIVPWNMPQFLIVTKLVPALLAGCTVVLKPAAGVPPGRTASRRDDRPDRPARRVWSACCRATRRRRTPGRPPRRRQGVVHRFHRGGPGRRGGVRAQPDQGQPRTRRQVRRHRPRRRRPGSRRHRRAVGQPVQQRPDLQRA